MVTKTSPTSAEAMSTPTIEDAPTSSITDRFVSTAEVTVSKIFPAGFADTLNFALTTGFGDFVGVLSGHTAYYAAKKAVTGSEDINMKAEAQTGFLLASAAFCSGTGWQPIVNCLQGMNLPFASVMAGTWVGCGTLFYLGLRGGRTIFSSMEHIEEPTYENSKNDASLSVAIGGATGFFVGTDAAYLPDQNFLINVVGIADGTPDLTGCAIAGSSTALGFAACQSAFNIAFPAGKCWND
ncbi:hypothetical protein TL16_g02642 [Triparma laevis f. inornata]|uniref:Uncharacterized protein n=1 Tax=Triparma laevis f. inornata TaxID=1714386 RepID=A0A9W7DW53_9STRA|nr:hypothetical protein TL16_g02642 [Triparma laevis f. inornata]